MIDISTLAGVRFGESRTLDDNFNPNIIQGFIIDKEVTLDASRGDYEVSGNLIIRDGAKINIINGECALRVHGGVTVVGSLEVKNEGGVSHVANP